MANRYNIIKRQEIVYSGPFDFEYVYQHMYKWLEHRQYDIEEKKFKDKPKPRAPIQREIEIEWKAAKDIDDYTKFEYNVYFRVINIKEITVKKDDEEKKMFNADIKIWVTADMLLDKEGYWESSPLLHFMKNFFEAYVYKSTFSHHKGILSTEALALYNEAKALLNLYKV